MTFAIFSSGAETVGEYAYDPWGKRVMAGTNPDVNNQDGEWNPTINYNFYGITGQRLAMVTCHGQNNQRGTCTVAGQNVYFGNAFDIQEWPTSPIPAGLPHKT